MESTNNPPIPEDQLLHAGEDIQKFIENETLPTDTLEQVHVKAAAIGAATESFTPFFAGSNIMTSIGDHLSTVATSVSKVADRAAEFTKTIFGYKADYTSIEEFAKAVPYFTISKKMKIINPPHLTGRWLPYIQFLKEMATDISTIESDLITPMTEYFSKIINKPSELNSSTFKPKYVMKDYEQYQKGFQKFFTGKARTHVIWSEAFGSNEELKLVIKDIIETKDILKQVPVERLQKAVSNLAGRANILAKEFKSKNSKYILNPAQTKYFSELLFVTAKFVELVSIAYQSVYELEQCILQTQHKLAD